MLLYREKLELIFLYADKFGHDVSIFEAIQKLGKKNETNLSISIIPSSILNYSLDIARQKVTST